ncbi:MAG: stage II sporulation protein R [Bacilli bacterium]|nr:stage II sporulation protein R [Bacilli bacterium]
MKKVLIALSIIILLLISNKEYEKIMIPEDSIRIRVIANSNNIDDQLMKLKVKNNIENILYKKLDNTKTIEEARENINNSIEEINGVVKKTLNNDNFTINYGKNYFPKKELYGINYKEGEYESLVVNIGESKGNNWWCVLFPPLCMIEVSNNDTNFVEYKSKVLEILNEYK